MLEEDVEVIVVAASDGYELEAVKLLASVGVSVRGYLEGGMTAWRSEERPVERVEMITPSELQDRIDDVVVLDVRGAGEFASGHIDGSVHIPYAQLLDRLDALPRNRPIATICSAGKRSGLAASILQREGFSDVLHVGQGGVSAWPGRWSKLRPKP